MKALKIVLIVLVVLVASVLLLGLLMSKDFESSRSVVINAPPEVVFKHISTFEMFNKWNPWSKRDPNQKTKLEGTDGTVGAKHSWAGNDDVGEGSMTLTKVETNKAIEYDLVFLKPFESKNFAYMYMETVEGGQKVTWGFKGSLPFPMNVAKYFMDKSIGKDFEEGLGTLKAMCEAAPSTPAAATYTVNETEWPETNALSVRQVVKFADIGNFFMTNLPKMHMAIQTAGAKAGIPLGIYYKYDEAKGETDMAAAVPFDVKKNFGKEFKELNLPATKAYTIDYYGKYEEMKPAYDEMTKYLKANFNRENPDLVIEQYVGDPETEKDPAKVHTIIWFFVKKEVAAK